MKNSVFIPSIILLAVFIYLPSQGSSEKPEGNSVQVPESQNQIVKLSDTGIDPKELHMKREDSVSFFLNQSANSLATLEIDFHNHATHCSSANMKIGDDGKIRSEKPIGPNDFASTCFHDTGTYDFTVYGLAKNPDGIHGKIIVE